MSQYDKCPFPDDLTLKLNYTDAIAYITATKINNAQIVRAKHTQTYLIERVPCNSQKYNIN